MHMFNRKFRANDDLSQPNHLFENLNCTMHEESFGRLLFAVHSMMAPANLGAREGLIVVNPFLPVNLSGSQIAMAFSVQIISGGF